MPSTDSRSAARDLARSATQRAAECAALGEPLEACRWYLTAADRYLEGGDGSSAATAAAKAARAATDAERPQEALAIAADAERLAQRAFSRPSVTAEIAIARALAHGSQGEWRLAAAAWDVALVDYVADIEPAAADACAGDARQALRLAPDDALAGSAPAIAAWEGHVARQGGADFARREPVIETFLRGDNVPLPGRFTQHPVLFARAKVTLATQVGEALTAGLDEAQLDELEALMGTGRGEGVAPWLDEHVPGHAAIVARTTAEVITCLAFVLDDEVGGNAFRSEATEGTAP